MVATPGHAADHVCFVLGDVCFCGDLILGQGSSIVPPAAGGGSLVDYMRSLEAVAALDAELLAPGHGPLDHRPRGEDRRVRRAPPRTRAPPASPRSIAASAPARALLDAAWDDVPEPMRPAAAIAMQAHLEKLEAEGRLDAGELID